jgi:calmodulin
MDTFKWAQPSGKGAAANKYLTTIDGGTAAVPSPGPGSGATAATITKGGSSSSTKASPTPPAQRLSASLVVAAGARRSSRSNSRREPVAPSINDNVTAYISLPSQQSHVAATKAAGVQQALLFTEGDVSRAFLRCDADKNGLLGVMDVRAIITAIGIDATDEEVDEMVGMIDFDGDGQVDFYEFRKLAFLQLMGMSQAAFAALPLPHAPIRPRRHRGRAVIVADNVLSSAPVGGRQRKESLENELHAADDADGHDDDLSPPPLPKRPAKVASKWPSAAARRDTESKTFTTSSDDGGGGSRSSNSQSREGAGESPAMSSPPTVTATTKAQNSTSTTTPSVLPKAALATISSTLAAKKATAAIAQITPTGRAATTTNTSIPAKTLVIGTPVAAPNITIATAERSPISTTSTILSPGAPTPVAARLTIPTMSPSHDVPVSPMEGRPSSRLPLPALTSIALPSSPVLPSTTPTPAPSKSSASATGISIPSTTPQTLTVTTPTTSTGTAPPLSPAKIATIKQLSGPSTSSTASIAAATPASSVRDHSPPVVGGLALPIQDGKRGGSHVRTPTLSIPTVDGASVISHYGLFFPFCSIYY